MARAEQFCRRGFFFRRANNNPAANAVRLAESIAELEYAIETHEILKRRTEHWLWAHIAASLVFYLLLALPVWSTVCYGLRWFG